MDNSERNQAMIWTLGAIGALVGVWVDYQLWNSMPPGAHVRIPIIVILAAPAIGAFIGVMLASFILWILDSGDKGDAAQSATPLVRGQSIAEEIERLSDLRHQGALTDEEYRAAKRRLLE